MDVTPSSLERMPLRSLIEFSALCARRARPALDRWSRAAKYRPAIDSAIDFAENFAFARELPRGQSGCPVGAAAVDAAIRKANTAQAPHAGFAASAAATAALAAQVAIDLVRTGYGVRLDRRRIVVNIVAYGYQQMLQAAETEAEREHYANAALRDLERLSEFGLDPPAIPESLQVKVNQSLKDVIGGRQFACALQGRKVLFACYGAVVGLCWCTILHFFLSPGPAAQFLSSAAFAAFFAALGRLYASDAEASIVQGAILLPLLPALALIVAACLAAFAISAVAAALGIKTLLLYRHGANRKPSFELDTVME
jgi:hypothetical protein